MSEEKPLQITLKAARVNAGFTQAEACKRLGIKKEKIISWEREPWNVTAYEQSKISRVYGISIDHIIFLPQD